jgi:pimeloyl-ACP methyl ester carboxylesterase
LAVLGHSFGGHVALEYALRYPGSLSHLVLVNTGGEARWEQQTSRGSEVMPAIRHFITADAQAT